MKRTLSTLLILIAMMQAKSFAAPAVANPLPDAPSQASHDSNPPFWSVRNKAGFGILTALITADAITTQRGLSEGMHEANPIVRPFVTRGPAGAAAGSALGLAAGVGTVYVLHCTHHYKAERIALGLIVSGESAVVGRNIAMIK